MAPKVVDGGGKFGVDRMAIVGDEGSRASPQGDVHVDERVGTAFGGEFGGVNGEHVSITAKTVGEKRDVGATASDEGQGSEEIISNYTAEGVWQRHRGTVRLTVCRQDLRARQTKHARTHLRTERSMPGYH